MLTSEERESQFSLKPSALASPDSRPVEDYPKPPAGAVPLTQHRWPDSFSWIFEVPLQLFEGGLIQKFSAQAFRPSGTSDLD